MIQNGKQAVLLLENGMEFVGKSCGAEGIAMGETVFTTTMVGYQETLTDSAFYGKLVTQTFPLLGNYGVNGQDDEAPRCYAAGYIIREWCEHPSNFRCEGDLNSYLKEHNIIGIYDIDTRRLTKILREEGEMSGVIVTGEYQKDELLKQLQAYSVKDAVAAVSVTEEKHCPAEHPEHRVAVLDLGVHRTAIEALNRRGCDVTVLPYDTTAEEILKAGFDGVLLPEGPGDPTENTDVIEQVKLLSDANLPMAGTGLGHQILALAHGASVSRLKYGHRGGNQPVINVNSGRTYVTAQNHGYVVDRDSVDPKVAQISFHNANDKTCEGLRYLEKPIISVQFTPDDMVGFYDEWMEMLEGEGKAVCH